MADLYDDLLKAAAEVLRIAREVGDIDAFKLVPRDADDRPLALLAVYIGPKAQDVDALLEVYGGVLDRAEDRADEELRPLLAVARRAEDLMEGEG